MTLTQAVTRIANLTNKLATESVKVIPRMKAHVNEVCRREWNGHPWSFRRREYPLALKTAVTTGTVSATNGSGALTFSSAVLSTSEHKGWYFRIVSDSPQNWYKVAAVSSTTAAIISPVYQGSNNATASYELIKLDYALPPEVDEVELVKLMYEGRYVTVTDIPSLQEGTPVLERALPQAVGIYESNPIPATYSTGTVSGTSGSNTLTGASTAWLANVLPGDVLTISSIDYTVYEVLSDTSLTLYNALTSTIAALTAYTATRQFQARLRVFPSTDLAYAVIVVGRRKYHNLVADSDSNELLNKYETAVVQSCVELEHIAGPDSRAIEQTQRSMALWDQAKAADKGSHPERKRRPIFSSRTYRG